MNNNTTNVLLNLIWATAITLMFLGFFAFLSILALPAKWTIELNMDNNTREAIQSINYTALEQRNCVCTDYNIAPHDCCYGRDKLSSWQLPNGTNNIYYAKDKLNEKEKENGLG